MENKETRPLSSSRPRPSLRVDPLPAAADQPPQPKIVTLPVEEKKDGLAFAAFKKALTPSRKPRRKDRRRSSSFTSVSDMRQIMDLASSSPQTQESSDTVTPPMVTTLSSRLKVKNIHGEDIHLEPRKLSPREVLSFDEKDAHLGPPFSDDSDDDGMYRQKSSEDSRQQIVQTSRRRRSKRRRALRSEDQESADLYSQRGRDSWYRVLMRMMSSYFSFFYGDYIKSKQSSNLKFKSEMCVIVLHAVFVLWMLDISMYLYAGSEQPSLPTIISLWSVELLLFLLFFVLFRKVNGRVLFLYLKWMCLLIVFFAISWRTLSSCRLVSPFLAWLYLVPSLSLILLNFRVGLGFLIACIIEVILIPLIPHSHTCKDQPTGAPEIYISIIIVHIFTFLLTWGSHDYSRKIFISLRKALSRFSRLNTLLSAARDAAVSSNVLKSRFLSNISHELNTPMSGILGFCHLLRKMDHLPDNVVEYVRSIESCAEKLQSQISDMLVFSKLESGNLHEEISPFCIPEIVENLVCSLAPVAHAKGLEIMVDLPSDFPVFVSGDHSFFSQVLRNLLVNAIKFTHEGEVRVTGEVQDEGADQVRVHFSVIDTGIGVAPDLREKIFDAFVQAESSGNRSYEGAGLGLAIASQLTKLLHGSVWVESDGRSGSTFHFTARFRVVAELPRVLRNSMTDSASTRWWYSNRIRKIPDSKSPLKVVEDIDSPEPIQDATVPAAAESKEPSSPSNPTANQRVLIVDDNRNTRHILSSMCVRLHMTPRDVRTYDQAMRELADGVRSGNPYSVVVMDEQLMEASVASLDDFLTSVKRISESSTTADSIDTSKSGDTTVPVGIVLMKLTAKPPDEKSPISPLSRAARSFGQLSIAPAVGVESSSGLFPPTAAGAGGASTVSSASVSPVVHIPKISPVPSPKSRSSSVERERRKARRLSKGKLSGGSSAALLGTTPADYPSPKTRDAIRDSMLLNSPTKNPSGGPEPADPTFGSLPGRKDSAIAVRIVMKPLTLPKLGTVLVDLMQALHRAHHPSHTHRRIRRKSSAGSSPRFKVLVVDDHEINLKICSMHLEKLGHIPFTVKSGSEAIDAVFSKDYDVVLMDFHMPGLSGPEATKIIRQKEVELGRNRLPIVCITANATSADREQCLRDGMDEFITKPYHPQKLQHIICKAVFSNTLASATKSSSRSHSPKAAMGKAVSETLAETVASLMSPERGILSASTAVPTSILPDPSAAADSMAGTSDEEKKSGIELV